MDRLMRYSEWDIMDAGGIAKEDTFWCKSDSVTDLESTLTATQADLRRVEGERDEAQRMRDTTIRNALDAVGDIARLKMEFLSYHSEYGHQLDVPPPVANYVSALETDRDDWKRRAGDAEGERDKAIKIMGGEPGDGDTLVELVAVTQSGFDNVIKHIALQDGVLSAQTEAIDKLEQSRDDLRAKLEAVEGERDVAYEARDNANAGAAAVRSELAEARRLVKRVDDEDVETIAALRAKLEAVEGDWNEATDRAVKAENALDVAYDAMDGFCNSFCSPRQSPHNPDINCELCPIKEHEKEATPDPTPPAGERDE